MESVIHVQTQECHHDFVLSCHEFSLFTRLWISGLQHLDNNSSWMYDWRNFPCKCNFQLDDFRITHSPKRGHGFQFFDCNRKLRAGVVPTYHWFGCEHSCTTTFNIKVNKTLEGLELQKLF